VSCVRFTSPQGWHLCRIAHQNNKASFWSDIIGYNAWYGRGKRGARHFSSELYRKKVAIIPRLRKRWLSLWSFLVRRGETLQHVAVVLATLMAAAWSLYLFLAERQSKPHLAIDLQNVQRNIPSSTDRKLIFFDLVLKNEGKRKLQAEEVVTTENAYQDAGEVLRYPCALQIRQIAVSMLQSNASLDFFNDTNELQCPSGIPPEIDMLTEYEMIIDKNSDAAKPEFWMEPGEEYRLGATVVLPKGAYLVRFHFVGNKSSDEEFWSRITFLQVD
jgi:hypothetical protein